MLFNIPILDSRGVTGTVRRISFSRATRGLFKISRTLAFVAEVVQGFRVDSSGAL